MFKIVTTIRPFFKSLFSRLIMLESFKSSEEWWEIMSDSSREKFKILDARSICTTSSYMSQICSTPINIRNVAGKNTAIGITWLSAWIAKISQYMLLRKSRMIHR